MRFETYDGVSKWYTQNGIYENFGVNVNQLALIYQRRLRNVYNEHEKANFVVNMLTKHTM